MKKIQDLVGRNKLVNFIFLIFYFPISLRSIYIANKRKKKYNFFNYSVFSKPLALQVKDPIIDCGLYGLSYVFKKYSGYKKKIKAYIEHGVYFGSLVRPLSIESFVPSIITFSKTRHFHIREKTNKNIITIGPYIHYAEDYFSEDEFDKIKTRLGKVLLVFPSHSFKNIEANYDSDEFIFFIEEIKADFDTVLICLYWKDVELGRGKIYESKGYTILTAGHINDKYFLSRLKAIIKLSDYSVSNKVGTHIGYCTHLKIPHYCFEQQTTYDSADKKSLAFEMNSRNQKEKEDLDIETGEVRLAFNNLERQITSEQIDVCEKYFGLSEIKSKKELFNLLSKR